MGGETNRGENCSDSMSMLACSSLWRGMFLHHIKEVVNPGLSIEGRTKRAAALICVVCFLVESMRSNCREEEGERFDLSTFNKQTT